MGTKRPGSTARRHRVRDSLTCTGGCHKRHCHNGDCHNGRRCMTSETSAGDTTLVAILRGVVPARVVEIGSVLYDAGIRAIEVPLNSPAPFASIEKLAACRTDWTIGAGTVLNVDD